MIDDQVHFCEPGLTHKGSMRVNLMLPVNDAWDLPKEATMTPFLERHPQWHNTSKVGQDFEWKGYYAFQQIGDQIVDNPF